MNLHVPIQDVILVLLVTGVALTPWPWLAPVVAAAYFVAIAIVADRREAPAPPAPPTEEPRP